MDGEDETASGEDETADGEDEASDGNDNEITAVFENPPPLTEEAMVTQITAGGIGMVSGWGVYQKS